MKILFQGDSITDAFRKPEELNPAYQLGNGYAFLVAASLSAKFPGQGLEFFNRGVSGNTVADLRTRWSLECLDLEADVVSLLVGVNDTIRAMKGIEAADDAAFLSTYESLLDSVKSRNPRARLILLEPFLLEVGEVTPDWGAHLKPRQRAIAKIAEERQLSLIPLQEIFDQACKDAPASYWTYDGIHPTHAGFNLIAEAWMEAGGLLLGLAQTERGEM